MARSTLATAAIALAIAIAWSSTAFAQAEGDSLTGRFTSTLSLRNPQTESRVVQRVVVTGGVRDTVDVTVGNPFDYEISAGFDGSYGPWHFLINETYERENGLEYLNQEYQGRYKHRYYEVGARVRDDEAANLQLITGYVEGIIKGWVGIGITRQYTKFWFEQGATLGRISLAKEQHNLMGIDLTIRATYEWNPDRYRVFAYTDVRNLSRGRYALVPFVKWERIDRSGAPSRDAYQAKVMLTIQI